MSTKVLLVAEDDDNDALLLERALRRSVPGGFRMVRVANGEELVAYLDGRAPYADRGAHPCPDLILLDLKMPRMDGFDVLRWRRQNDAALLIPVVVFSSSTLARDISEASRLGASSYVVKPMRSDALDSFVRALHDWWGRFNVAASVALA